MKDLEVKEINTEVKQVFKESVITALELSSVGKNISDLSKFFI